MKEDAPGLGVPWFPRGRTAQRWSVRRTALGDGIPACAAHRVIRRTAHVLILVISLLAPAPSFGDTATVRAPLGQPGGEAKRHYAPPLPVDSLHVKLELTVDLAEESLTGSVTHTFVAVGSPVAQVTLDSVGLSIEKVVDGAGNGLKFHVGLEQLDIYLAKPLEVGAEATVQVFYHVRRPEGGIHFRTSRMGYAPEETQAWTQGEATDSRYWYPSFDTPHERASTEVVATVAAPNIALSNGQLLETRDNPDGTRTFHWLQQRAHAAYLVSVVVGPFVELKDEADGVPLFYYVLPGREAEAQLTFGKTPDMMRFFNERIGVPYPYERYSQVAVVDFIAGGMENTTISTIADRMLHDEAAHLTYSADLIVAHELAHQWYGDLITSRAWSQIWLNEGFATYFQMLYFEHDRGRDALELELIQGREKIFTAEADIRLPLVRTSYATPLELFDTRSYEKGAWVLHMLRRHLGDTLFFRCIREYTARNQDRSVETNDLLRNFEEVSGESLEQFFKQWVNTAGFPEVAVEYTWDQAKKLAKVTVRQTQEISEESPIFVFPLELLFALENAETVREQVQVLEQVQTVYVTLAEAPQFVRADPALAVLMRLNFTRPEAMLLAQLKGDPSYAAAHDALNQLRGATSAEAVAAVAEVLARSTYWAARSEAARTLAAMQTDDALPALLAGLGDGDARVRRDVAEALGGKKDDQVIEALRAVVREEQEPSPYVVAAAVNSLRELGVKDAAPDVETLLKGDSHAEVVRRAALDALADFEAVHSLDAVRALAEGQDRPRVRPAALRAIGKLGKLGEDTEALREELAAYLEDANPFVREGAIDALVELGDQRAVAVLERHAGSASKPAEQQAAREAANKLREQAGQPEEMKKLREEVQSLQESEAALEKRLDDVEEVLKAVKVAD